MSGVVAGAPRRLLPLTILRYAFRTRPAPRRVILGLLVSLVALVLGAWLVIANVGGAWMVAWTVVASLLCLAGVGSALFSPGLAVSVVGVALACASLMTSLAVVRGFERAVVEAMGRVNGHVLLTKYGLDFFEYENIAARFALDDEVRAISPFAYSMVALVVDGREQESFGQAIAVAKGLDPVAASRMSGIVDALRMHDLSALRPGDTQHLPGIVLGTRLASALGAAVGDELRVVVPAQVQGEAIERGPPRWATFEVLDLMETGVSDVDRGVAFMHLTAAQALFFREGRVTGLEIELADPYHADAFATRLRGELPSMYRLHTWRETNAATLASLSQIRVVLTLVLGLMALVSATSLVASLVLLVRRKQPDIAVLMAIGAAPRAVFWMFEGIGILAGSIGVCFGLALGSLYCAIVARLEHPLTSDVYPVDQLPVALSAFDVVVPAVLTLGLCALASGPVALWATHVQIVAGMNRT